MHAPLAAAVAAALSGLTTGRGASSSSPPDWSGSASAMATARPSARGGTPPTSSSTSGAMVSARARRNNRVVSFYPPSAKATPRIPVNARGKVQPVAAAMKFAACGKKASDSKRVPLEPLPATAFAYAQPFTKSQLHSRSHACTAVDHFHPGTVWAWLHLLVRLMRQRLKP